MEDLVPKLRELANLILISAFLWAGGRITHGLQEMRARAAKSWQRALTEVIGGFVGFLAIGAALVLLT